MPNNKDRNTNWDPYGVIEDAQALQRVAEQKGFSDPLLSRGMYLAEPILLSLAIEMALKAWQRQERQEAPEPTHDLLKLFEDLKPETQKLLQAKMPALVNPLVGETLSKGMRELLCAHKSAHTDWRYLYEASGFKIFETPRLHEALRVIIDAYGERWGVLRLRTYPGQG